MVSEQHSQRVGRYFDAIETELSSAYALANAARSLGFDPEETVDIPLTKTLPERVESLVGAAVPQLKGSGVAARITELEKQYGAQAWECAMQIALEVAQQKFCSFPTVKEAMEAGIRTGFAYNTVGIVSAPLEGFIELKMKKRKDGKEYLAMIYAGPVRGAGGTAAAVSLLIADYVRLHMGYAPYDATEDEVNRSYVELVDYHERVTNLQYKPSSEEVKFLVSRLPLEIDGDPTEEIEVSNFKDMPRIETNRIRGGMCLVLSMIALKAPKLWKSISKFPKEFGIKWDFLPEFLTVQKKAKAQQTSQSGGGEKHKKLMPDFTYIADLVAGRPVLSYPLRRGGFRLRYGRNRVSGYSAASLHPNTLFALDNYVATGTQLKVERPGKAAAITPCDSIEPPTVLLKDGSVRRFDGDVRHIVPEIQEILYLGDILISYGDFFDRAHPLVPAGYCEEWHVQEFEARSLAKFQTLDPQQLSEATGLPRAALQSFIGSPLSFRPNADIALALSHHFGIPLHPRYSYYFSALAPADLDELVSWFSTANIIFDDQLLQKIVLPMDPRKRLLEILGVPHILANSEFVVLEQDEARVLFTILRLGDEVRPPIPADAESALEALNSISPILVRDKAGTFIGSRMGRPEKSKMRKLTGSPQALFPVGEEGGRMRSFQAAISAGKITSSFPFFYCVLCARDEVYASCTQCGNRTVQRYHCRKCGVLQGNSCTHGPADTFLQKSIDIKHYFDHAVALSQVSAYPDLIKGVRGTSNKDHVVEPLAKGILRSKYDLFVNKDGTIRYDMSELPLTHFTPREVCASVEKLRSLGYDVDIHGAPLEHPDQVVEIFVQDIILPNGAELTEESAANVLIRICNFIDDLLVNFYRQRPYYNVKNQDDLIGQLVIGLAPHISAGIVGRIVGFSQTQGFFAHPLYHAAMRRDADGDEACVMMLMDGLLNFSRRFLPDSRGSRTMDSPLVLSAIILPSEVDDMAHRVDVSWRYPLALYEAASAMKPPWDVQVELLGKFLGTPRQYEAMGYTHPVSSINMGVTLSAYKTLETMQDKLRGQMAIAEKVRAVDAPDVARLVIDKHFIKDIKGNLRRFSSQEFRCIECNEIFRRPPLKGKCPLCNGKLVFTVSEMSIIKYLEPALSLARHYSVDPYISQTLEITKTRYLEVFGKDAEKQEGLGKWFG